MAMLLGFGIGTLIGSLAWLFAAAWLETCRTNALYAQGEED